MDYSPPPLVRHLDPSEDVKVKPMEMCSDSKLGSCTFALHIGPFLRYMLGRCYWNIFICLTSIPIYIGHWKSFMKFGIKKSHEMISYILVGIILLSVWIALLTGWNYRSSTKPCNLAQRTLDGLYNKSHERFMLSKCLENAPMDRNG
jgi:hypothetical protein